MVSVTIDDSSLSSEDLDQIMLVDNFLNHVSQMLATKTESMNMFVGTEIVGNMRVSDRDNIIQHVFLSSDEAKDVEFTPKFEKAYTIFMDKYGYRFVDDIPTLLFLIVTASLPVDLSRFVRRQAANNVVLSAVFFIPRSSTEEHTWKAIEVWRSACLPFSNIKIVVIRDSSDLGKQGLCQVKSWSL